MKYVSDRLFKLTTYGCSLLFIVYLFLCSEYVRADTNDDMTQIAAICASSNALIATQSNSDLILAEAQWWMALLKEFAGEEAGTAAAALVMHNLQDAYNSGEMSWSQLVDIGQACNPLRSEIIELSR